MYRDLYKLIITAGFICAIFNIFMSADFHGGLGWAVASMLFGGEFIKVYSKQETD